MKSVKSNIFAINVRVEMNTQNKNAHRWARIINADTNQILHTGQVGYIKKVAKNKYNVKVSV